jgi:hypothetical protein
VCGCFGRPAEASQIHVLNILKSVSNGCASVAAAACPGLICTLVWFLAELLGHDAAAAQTRTSCCSCTVLHLHDSLPGPVHSTSLMAHIFVTIRPVAYFASSFAGGGSSNWYLPGGFSYHEGDASDPRMTAAGALADSWTC